MENNRNTVRKTIHFAAIVLIVSALLAVVFWVTIKLCGHEDYGIVCLHAVVLLIVWGIFSVAFLLFGLPALRRWPLPLVFLVIAALYGLLYAFTISPLARPFILIAYSYRIIPYFGVCTVLLLLLKFKTACCIQLLGLFTGIFWGELIGGFTGYSIWRMYMDIFSSQSEIRGFSEELGLGIIWGMRILATLVGIGYEVYTRFLKETVSCDKDGTGAK